MIMISPFRRVGAGNRLMQSVKRLPLKDPSIKSRTICPTSRIAPMSVAALQGAHGSARPAQVSPYAVPS